MSEEGKVKQKETEKQENIILKILKILIIPTYRTNISILIYINLYILLCILFKLKSLLFLYLGKKSQFLSSLIFIRGYIIIKKSQFFSTFLIFIAASIIIFIVMVAFLAYLIKKYVELCKEE